jgi:hypothetical protein
MSRFVKILIVIALVLGAMLLLTYLTPGIKTFAQGIAKTSHLPLWLVGLAAPILYGLKSVANFLAGLVGEGPTEKTIREKNEAISARLDDLERSVKQLDEWRTREISSRMEVIREREKQIAPLEARARALDATIAGLQERKDALPEIEDFPGLIE